ncbi:hypothetical protein H0H93_014284 [Arthromyces matolae]|nr:hypothetical protein H0H93_014284 [Arthromyces matolae]
MTIKERLDKWHARNPGQRAAASISGNANSDADQMAGQATMAGMLYEHLNSSRAQPAVLVQSVTTAPKTTPLTKEDHIAILEKEIATLRVNAIKSKAVFDGVQVPKAPYKILRKPVQDSVPKEAVQQPTKPIAIVPTVPTIVDEPEEIPPVAVTPPPPSTPNSTPTNEPAIKPTIPIAQPQPQKHAEKPAILTDKGKGLALPITDRTPSPIHPFARLDAKDCYVPPAAKNLAVANKRAEGVYQNVAPIVADAEKAKDVFERCLDSRITVSVEEICSLAPDIRGRFREAVTPKRIIAKEAVYTATARIENANDEIDDALVPAVKSYAIYPAESLARVDTPQRSLDT